MNLTPPRVRQVLVSIPLAILLLLVGPPLFSPLTEERWLHMLTGALVLIALPGALLFAWLYARVDWYRSLLGIAVMWMAVSLSGVVVLGALRVFADWPMVWETYSGDPLPVDLARATVYLSITGATYFKVAVLWWLNRRGSDLHSDDAEVRADQH